MNCKNFKIKQKNYKRIFYCSVQRKEIDYHKCSKGCKDYEDKIKNSGFLNKSTGLKKKSKELAKLEKNRFSILGSTKNKCFLCPSTTDLTWHEIYRGKNRANSMKYGLCLRLCHNCHERWQEDKEFNDYWHIIGQKKFMEYYHKSIGEFIDIFGRNYL